MKMAKKIIFLLLIYCSSSNATIYKNALIKNIKAEKIRRDKEIEIIAEIKGLLAEATPPKEALCPWLTTHVPVLTGSKHMAIKNVAQVLHFVQKNETTKINPLSVISTFVEAVQIYHPDFSLGWMQSARAVVVGTRWFLTSPSCEV